MALKDKLEQQESMTDLLNETKKLNEQMTSYIRVQMQEATAKNMTIDSQLNRIRENSNEILERMNSILQQQSVLLEKGENDLRQVLTDGQQQMQDVSQQTVKKLNELQTTNDSLLQTINENMTNNMSEIQSSTKSLVNDTKNEMQDLAASTRKSALISNWLDALKYGGTGAVLTSAIMIVFYYAIL